MAIPADPSKGGTLYSDVRYVAPWADCFIQGYLRIILPPATKLKKKGGGLYWNLFEQDMRFSASHLSPVICKSLCYYRFSTVGKEELIHSMNLQSSSIGIHVSQNLLKSIEISVAMACRQRNIDINREGR